MSNTTNLLPNTYEMDETTYVDDVGHLPPTVSPSAASINIDSKQSYEFTRRVIKAYRQLQEQWGCDKPGHDICLQGTDYVGHIQLSEEQVSIWAGEICRGRATCLYPPDVIIIPDASRSNREVNFDWDASTTNTGTGVEIGPGYFCGLALERVGTIILYRAKISMLVGKLWLYHQIVNSGRPNGITRQLRKRLSIRNFGIIIQDSADLMQPSYPLYIRERASEVLYNAHTLSHGYDGDEYLHWSIPGWLGYAFYLFGYLMDRKCDNAASTAALYRSPTSAPLHTHHIEITSTFLSIIARCAIDSRDCVHLLTNIVLARVNDSHTLSVNSLNAIYSFLESSLQP
ncbi:hypothetical protein BU17DRAFT_97380 [Hysterangium stoloniferum]|nr:hypothetical protein BU17DRAFT_97380 [Hysterangium stoloniferum]